MIHSFSRALTFGLGLTLGALLTLALGGVLPRAEATPLHQGFAMEQAISDL